MATMTSYGTWCTEVDKHNATVEATVATVFDSEGADGFDFDAIVAEYREAINVALPPNVALTGDEFVGPYYADDCNFDGYPADEDGEIDLKAIVDDIDLWQIVQRHETAA